MTVSNTGSASGNYMKPPAFSDSLPSGYKARSMANYTPQQMGLHQSLFSNVQPGSYLSRLAGGDEALYGEMEAPAKREFAGQLGNIASRFSGMGMGARRSSGFQNYTTQAASDFSQDLQAKRQGLRRQALNDLMGLSGELLNQRPYERFLEQKEQSQQGGWGGAASGAASGATMGASFGPWGALAGGVLGGAAGYFSKK